MVTTLGSGSVGASQAAIAFHYDVGNDFYRLWLDSSLTYTCALWDASTPTESLQQAQLRKIDFHVQQAQAQGVERVLDVGCGWGGFLQRLIQTHGVGTAVGLTLSHQQAEWITAQAQPQIEVRLESWEEHVPAAPYDAIVSVEAFEAFVRPGLSRDDKIAAYRHFFKHCHDWLRPGGRLSLQTIAYGNSSPEDFDSFIANEIFPESDLPCLAEIAAATERIFEVVALRNDRLHYVPTLQAWLRGLKAQRQQAIALVGEATVQRYERFLRLSSYMFSTGACDLYRITLQRIDAAKP